MNLVYDFSHISTQNNSDGKTHARLHLPKKNPNEKDRCILTKFKKFTCKFTSKQMAKF